MLKEIKEAIEETQELMKRGQFSRKALQTLISLAQSIIDLEGSNLVPGEKKTPRDDSFDAADHEVPIEIEAFNNGHNACRSEMLLRLASPKLRGGIGEIIKEWLTGYAGNAVCSEACNSIVRKKGDIKEMEFYSKHIQDFQGLETAITNYLQGRNE